VWPQAIVQTCIIHLIRNTFRLTARQYWDEIKRDLKPIYTAVNATAARAALDELADKFRNHLRRPIPGCRDLLMETAGNIVRETVPRHGPLVRVSVMVEE
jgi:transposase-like protein